MLHTAESAVDQIRLNLSGLRVSEAKVGRWIVANARRLPSLSMGQVAAECDVSDTTVLRLCRRVGFHGFTELKFRFIEDGARLVTRDPGLDDAVGEDDHGGNSIAATVFEDSIQGLRDTLAVLGDSIDVAVDLIDAADQILVIGVGTSRPVIDAIQSQFFRLGLNCRMQTDSYLQLMEVALLVPKALVIGVSHSGASLDPIETLRLAKANGLATMCITGIAGSPITAHADVVLTSIATELRSEAVVGRVVQIALASALARAYAERHPARTVDSETKAFEAVIGK
ncbi:MAG: MurR/RpiR family transcriptional regulator, partial [Ilumatobacteraceae bacterium]